MDNGAFGELYQVKINGLWGKTDIVFDLYKDCNILIGENGIGKSTALKILESILELNFIHTAKYIFESIEFVFDTEQELKIEYADFIVSEQVIEDAFHKIYSEENTTQKILRAKFKKLIGELFETKLIGRFLNAVYHERYTSEIMHLVSNYIPIDLIKPLKDGFEFFQPQEDEFGDTTPIISYAQTNFLKSKAAQKVADGIYNPPIFSDMVNKVKFYYGDESFVKYHYTDRVIDANQEYKYTFWKCDTESDIENLLLLCEKNTLHKSIKNENLCYNGKFIKNLFEDRSEHTTLEILKVIRDKTGYFDINSVIKKDWYSFEDVSALNYIALEGAVEYKKLIKAKKEYSKDEAATTVGAISQEMLHYHKYYLFPLLAEENPFKVNLEQIIIDVWTYFEQDIYDEYYVDCLRLLESYASIYNLLYVNLERLHTQSTDLKAYESMVEEFISDKEIFLTPAGLFLCLKDVLSTVDRTDFYKFEYTKLPLSKISSGETKILALTYFILNSSSSVLIMDEPELSTSLIWQEKMLPTVLDYGNFQCIVVATHSPFMVRDDSLKDYIQYLP